MIKARSLVGKVLPVLMGVPVFHRHSSPMPTAVVQVADPPSDGANLARSSFITCLNTYIHHVGKVSQASMTRGLERFEPSSSKDFGGRRMSGTCSHGHSFLRARLFPVLTQVQTSVEQIDEKHNISGKIAGAAMTAQAKVQEVDTK